MFVGTFAARVFVAEPLHIALFNLAFVHLGGIQVRVDDAVDFARLVDQVGGSVQQDRSATLLDVLKCGSTFSQSQPKLSARLV